MAAPPAEGQAAPDHEGAAAVPSPPEERKSRWTPERLRELLLALPAAKVFPELAERAAAVLALWSERFPIRVWSRFVRFADSGTGRTQQLPKVVKEFNEIAPALARLLDWVQRAADAGQPPLAVVDLCSGFGFLSMFAAELLPREAVESIYLVDSAWPNRGGKDRGSGVQTTEHIYACGAWRIPLVTLQIDCKKGTDVRGLAKHVLRDPCPTILCGIHLCGTLSLRAIQLFNDGLASGCGVTGLILAPCCLPRKQHARRKFRYEVGGYSFTAQDLHAAKDEEKGAFERYTEHLLSSIQSEEKSWERIGILHESKDVNHAAGSADQDVFLFAQAPFRHSGPEAGAGVQFGLAVVHEEPADQAGQDEGTGQALPEEERGGEP